MDAFASQFRMEVNVLIPPALASLGLIWAVCFVHILFKKLMLRDGEPVVTETYEEKRDREEREFRTMIAKQREDFQQRRLEEEQRRERGRLGSWLASRDREQQQQNQLVGRGPGPCVGIDGER